MCSGRYVSSQKEKESSEIPRGIAISRFILFVLRTSKIPSYEGRVGWRPHWLSPLPKLVKDEDRRGRLGRHPISVIYWTSMWLSPGGQVNPKHRSVRIQDGSPGSASWSHLSLNCRKLTLQTQGETSGSHRTDVSRFQG